MNDQFSERKFDELESALEPAVQAVLSEPVPDDAVERVETRANTLDQPVASPQLPGRAAMRRWAQYSSLAVAVVLGCAVVVGVARLLKLPELDALLRRGPR